MTEERLAQMRAKHNEFLAGLKDRPTQEKDGIGEVQRDNLYMLNLAAYMGEAFVGPLLDYVDELLIQLDGAMEVLYEG